MGELSFSYGTMASAKSANLLMKCHQQTATGIQCILMKPHIDNRWEEKHITSRAVQSKPCELIYTDPDIKELFYSLIEPGTTFVSLFVDEVQFLTLDHIEQLWELSRLTDINVEVHCYGLLVTYLNDTFKSSNKLLIHADKTECLASKCQFCYNNASTHLRIVNGTPIKSVNDEQDIIKLGDTKNSNEYYASVCQSCYKNPPENL